MKFRGSESSNKILVKLTVTSATVDQHGILSVAMAMNIG